MSIAAIPPLHAVQALNPGQAAAHLAPASAVPEASGGELQANVIAQQQLFEMLMQNTQSTIRTEMFKAPKEEDDD
jgi:hypothetical protein